MQSHIISKQNDPGLFGLLSTLATLAREAAPHKSGRDKGLASCIGAFGDTVVYSDLSIVVYADCKDPLPFPEGAWNLKKTSGEVILSSADPSSDLVSRFGRLAEHRSSIDPAKAEAWFELTPSNAIHMRASVLTSQVYDLTGNTLAPFYAKAICAFLPAGEPSVAWSQPESGNPCLCVSTLAVGSFAVDIACMGHTDVRPVVHEGARPGPGGPTEEELAALLG